MNTVYIMYIHTLYISYALRDWGKKESTSYQIRYYDNASQLESVFAFLPLTYGQREVNSDVLISVKTQLSQH